MKIGVLAITAVVGAALAASAVAAPKPVGNAKGKQVNAKARMGPLSGHDGGPWSDNFDSYTAGTGIIGQGGWVGWAGTVPPPDGFVANNPVGASAPNSLRMTVGNGTSTSNTDAVQTYTVAGGKWKFTGKSFIPSSTSGVGYWIILNTYPAFNWSVQVQFDSGLNTVSAQQVQAGSPTQLVTLPMIKDQWVAHETLIDLDTLTYTFKYGGQIVIENGGWGAINTLQALDCYSDSIVDMYYDDLSLQPDIACYPDCNASGTLTVADFGCFQTKFVGGDPYADCNASGTLTVADFGCFQTKFVTGCP